MTCIVFDIDNTLVHTTTQRGEDAHAIPIFDGGLWLHVRPHARSLLRNVFEMSTMCIWTAGTVEYATAVAASLVTFCDLPEDAFSIVLSRDDAIYYAFPHGAAFVKDLDVVRKRIGTNETVYLVDDNPVHLHVERNIGCIIPVSPFYYTDGEQCDCMLIYVMMQLEVMHRVRLMHRPVARRATEGVFLQA